MKNGIDKYFDSSSFVSLALVMPATIVIISFILREFKVNALFELFMKYQNSMYFFTIVMIMCAVSVMISFAGIISANLNYNLSSSELVMNRSYFNLALLFFPYSYAIFIFFFLELEKFGNIPIGRG